MQRPYLTLIGFVFFALGVLSIILSLVGLKIDALKWIYGYGIWTVVVQLILLFVGIIMMYVSRVSEEDSGY